jgi:predicted nucleic acid-binding protein
MNDRYFVDTNILVYAFDRFSGVKHVRANAVVSELLSSGQGVVSTQVLQELAVSLRRKVAQPLTRSEIRRVVEDFETWRVFVNTTESILYALEIEERHGISFWDAMIVQAAENSGAGTLYTEDLSDGQTYGKIRVVNPFKQSHNTD